MNYILYPFYAVATVAMSIVAILLSPLVAMFIDSNGYLPRWLAWFEPSDNPAIGDLLWSQTHPNYGMYMLAVTYMRRNPAQGFDQFLQAKVDRNTPTKTYGNPNIRDGEGGIAGWYLIIGGGYFHLSYIYHIPFTEKCATGGFGWRLHSIGRRETKTLGQFVFTPIRFFRFT